MPDLPTRDDIERAAHRLAPHIRYTPILELEDGAFDLDCRVILKLEYLQVSGSFKARGAFNLLLSRPVPEAGVAAASGGNFGLAIAYAARKLGHRATIFIPDSTAAAKTEALRRLGCDLNIVHGYYADALAASREFVETKGALFAHAFDQPEIVAGAGSIAREIEEQCSPLPDTVVVAVGGAGLIGGTSAWFPAGPHIVGVETEGTASFHAALAAGHPVDVEIEGIGADALGAARVGETGFALAKAAHVESVIVSDQELIDARHRLWDEVRIDCEFAAAAPLAALLNGAATPSAGSTVCLVVCGANTTTPD